jgi:hypothetical protein
MAATGGSDDGALGPVQVEREIAVLAFEAEMAHVGAVALGEPLAEAAERFDSPFPRWPEAHRDLAELAEGRLQATGHGDAASQVGSGREVFVGAP